MKSHGVRWTDEEIDKLADMVLSMRTKDPGATVVSMVKRAQKQLPEGRQRKITGNLHIKAILDRIAALDREVRLKAEKCSEVESKLSFLTDLPADRDQLLDSLDDEELLERFSPRLLQLISPADLVGNFRPEQVFDSYSLGDLAATLARRVVALLEKPIRVTVNVPETPGMHELLARRNGNGNGKRKSAGRKLRVLVIGMKGGNQRQAVEKGVGELCSVRFLATNQVRKDTLPTAIDKIIVWSKFSNHRVSGLVKERYPGRNIIEHFGGIEEMIALIEGMACALR
jgi:hypothetical protein